MGTKELIAGILVGLATLIAFGALLIYCGYVNNMNNTKVQNMTELCIGKGYQGWHDILGCFR
jgi:hypothetical protein